MKVAAVDVFSVTLPFRLSFGHSLASRKQSTNLIVKVSLADGSVGWGEAVPREYVTGEQTQEAAERIQNLFAPALLSAELPQFPELAGMLGELFSSFGLESKRWGASWCALETAVLDAVARSQSAPLASLLGPVQHDSVRYGAVVPFCGRAAMVAILLFYKVYGFKTVKVKVGKELDEDLDRLKLARRILGADVTLRVDANCAWSVEETMRASELFRVCGVASYEQPLPANDIAGMARLTSALAEEVVADESLCTLDDARLLVEEKACGGFNIRLSKVGGLLPAGKMAALARSAGINCHLGAQVGESGILSAAGRLFACTEGQFQNYEGSANLFLLKQDLIYENVTVGWGGNGQLLPGAGLAVTVSPERLSACMTGDKPVGLTDDQPRAGREHSPVNRSN